MGLVNYELQAAIMQKFVQQRISQTEWKVRKYIFMSKDLNLRLRRLKEKTWNMKVNWNIVRRIRSEIKQCAKVCSTKNKSNGVKG